MVRFRRLRGDPQSVFQRFRYSGHKSRGRPASDIGIFHECHDCYFGGVHSEPNDDHRSHLSSGGVHLVVGRVPHCVTESEASRKCSEGSHH